MYDIVVRNGLVVDGTGLASQRADVGIRDGLIVRVGRIRERGREEVDAEGHVVTPGFIDGHTHMDAQVFWDPLGSCSCWHGVTTVVMGNCGFSLAPAHGDRRDLVVRNLERAEDISPAAMAAGIEWTWESFPEYLDSVDRAPKGINYASNIGHSALRTWVMGDRAFEQQATNDDLDAMAHQLREALGAGAIGFTTSRASAHETPDDRPVASRLASWDEVRHLVGVMGDEGSGIFEIALEDASFSRDDTERGEVEQRMRTLAVETGVPFTFGVLAPHPKQSAALLELIDSTVAAGGTMFGQSHCREFAVLMSFKTRLPFDNLPEWRELRAESLARQRELLSDPAIRRRLVEATDHATYKRAIGAEVRPPNFDKMRILDSPLPPNPVVSAVAKQRGMHPVDLMIELALATDFDQLFLQVLNAVGPASILETMRHPRAVMTFSDSGAHVSQIMDSSIQTHLLGHWVRNEQAFSLEEAVRMLTLVPARAWGFTDRGLIREGLVADLNIFDPTTIAPAMPKVTTDLPAGARRLKQGAVGILATLVGGRVVLRNGEHTGELPGRLLRKASVR